jgi:sorbitol-specific phosphotransferase system component IIC
MSRLLAIVLVVSMLVGVFQISLSSVKAQPPAPAMWLQPETEAFNISTASVGTLFNVTGWINVTENSTGWSAALTFNPAQLQVVTASFSGSGGLESQWLQSSGIPTSSVIAEAPSWSNTAGTIGEPSGFGETAYAPYVATSSLGSLFVIEFNITEVPPAGTTLSSVIQLDPNVCYGFDINGLEELGFSLGNCAYSFVGPQVTALSATITASSTSIYLGQSVMFNSTVSGGSPPYTLQWIQNGSSVLNATSGTWSFTPGATGTYSVYLNVTDNIGENVQSNTILITVLPPLSGTSLYVDPSQIVDLTLVPSSMFYVNVTLANASNIATCGFNMTYDPTVLRWAGIDLFQVQGQIPTASAELYPSGSIWLNLTYPTAFSTDAPVPLVTIRFFVVSYGISPINLTNTQLFDSLGNPVSHNVFDGLFINIIIQIAVTSVVPSTSWVFQGYVENINVTVANLGNISETFNVTAYYNSTAIGTDTVTNLAPGANSTFTFAWDTTGVSLGNYTISGVASIVPYEMYFNTAENTYVDGVVTVYPIIHDVAITNIVVSPSWVFQGQNEYVNVTATNMGNLTESFTVTAYYNGTAIGTLPVTGLAPNANAVSAFVWNTTGVPVGTYTISAMDSIVPNYNTTNYYLSDGQVTIYPVIHDVAITSVVPSISAAVQGTIINVTVTATNLGNLTEPYFNVTAYYNSTAIGNLPVVNLASGASAVLTFPWNTTGVAVGTYTMAAQDSLVPNINVTNYYLTDGQVQIVALTQIAIVNIFYSFPGVAASLVVHYPPYAPFPWAYQGEPMNVTVTAANLGAVMESFNVTVTASDSGGIVSYVFDIVNLAPGATINETFSLNTASFTPNQNCTITAQATIVPGEANPAENTLVSQFLIRYVGDVNGDGTVNLKDIAIIARAMGSTPTTTGWDPEADITGPTYLVPDGIVNQQDLTLVARNFGL